MLHLLPLFHPCRSVLASEGLALWGGLVVQMLGELLLPLMADLARLVNTRSRDHAGVEKPSTAVVPLPVPGGASHLLAILPGAQAGLPMTGHGTSQREGAVSGCHNLCWYLLC